MDMRKPQALQVAATDGVRDPSFEPERFSRAGGGVAEADGVCKGFSDSIGYKSGRNALRDTPDAASIASTRSAGTLRRHFCTAWYETPNVRANGSNPPHASIARSIAEGSDSSTTLSSIGIRRPKIQPIVAHSQQLISVYSSATLQPMVAKLVKTKAEAMKAFGVRLHAALDALPDPPPERGRIGWLKARMGKNSVSYESMRKWLSGEAIPDQANLIALCENIGIRSSYLMDAEEPKIRGQEHAHSELLQIYATLDEQSQRDLINQARKEQTVTETRRPAAPPARRKGVR